MKQFCCSHCLFLKCTDMEMSYNFSRKAFAICGPKKRITLPNMTWHTMIIKVPKNGNYINDFLSDDFFLSKTIPYCG